MPIQKGNQPGRPDKYTPNRDENKQVAGAMKAARVPVTPENQDRVHRSLPSGLNYPELVAFIKDLFEK